MTETGGWTRFLGGFAYALENMTLEFELEAWTGQITGDTRL